MNVTLDDKIDCLTREVRFRRQTYPALVAAHRMTLAEAEAELMVMQAVLNDLLDQQAEPLRREVQR